MTCLNQLRRFSSQARPLHEDEVLLRVNFLQFLTFYANSFRSFSEPVKELDLSVLDTRVKSNFECTQFPGFTNQIPKCLAQKKSMDGWML